MCALILRVLGLVAFLGTSKFVLLSQPIIYSVTQQNSKKRPQKCDKYCSYRMTMSAGDEQSGLREVRFTLYETSAGADVPIRQATQSVERAETVSC